MTPEQFTALTKILSMPHHYSITGADDWPMLMTLMGVLVALWVYIWQDLKKTIICHRREGQVELEKEIEDRKEQDSFIWKALREHKEDCQKERDKL